MRPYALLACAGALFLAGCETTEMRHRDLALTTELRNLRSDIERMQERLGGIEQQQARLHADMDTVRRETAAARQADRARTDALAQRVEAVDRAREQDRVALLEDLSKRMAAVLAQTRAPAPAPPQPPRPRPTGAQTGFEHEVKPGQTLSEIARAYNTSVESIRDANNIQGDRIRVGQKLFIPE